MAAKAARQPAGTTANAITATKTASQTVLDRCLDLVVAEADYQAKLGEHLGAKTALITAVSASIAACSTNTACTNSPETLKALVDALKIAADMQVGASPVLLTKPAP